MADSGSIAFDTSVVVAALLSWHEHHDIARPILQAALDSHYAAILPVPALIESYSVMTRLPPPWRLGPSTAHELLTATFSGRALVVGLDGAETWSLIDGLPGQGVAGGASYDAHILYCARKAGATRLATFNVRHFERLDLGTIALLVP